MNPLHGVDVSSYQGSINWSLVKEQKKIPIQFAVSKATEGLGYNSPTFPYDWREMKRVGLKRGAYHFFHPTLSGSEQADYLHRWVRQAGGFRSGDFVLLDMEYTQDYAPPRKILSEAQNFVNRAKKMINKAVFIYVGYYYWIDNVGDAVDSVLSKCPLWVPSYGQFPSKPRNWKNISFWQYSETGTLPGIGANVDLDMFFGNQQQLNEVIKVF